MVLDMYGPCTAEGENSLMAMQTTRFLLKTLHKVQSGESVVGIVKYLEGFEDKLDEKCQATRPGDWFNLDVLKHALQIRAISLLTRAAGTIQAAMASGMSMAESFSEAGWEVVEASRGHCELVVFTSFVSQLEKLAVSPQLSRVLDQLAALYGAFILERNMSEVLEVGYINPEQTQSLREALRSLLTEIQTVAVPLMDGFNFRDFTLRTAIGKHSGDVYSNLFQSARETELNNPLLDETIRQGIFDILSVQSSRL